MQLSDINETNKGHFAVVAETIEKNILKGEVAYNKKVKLLFINLIILIYKWR